MPRAGRLAFRATQTPQALNPKPYLWSYRVWGLWFGDVLLHMLGTLATQTSPRGWKVRKTAITLRRDSLIPETLNPTLTYQALLCRAHPILVLGCIIRTYKQVGYGSLRYPLKHKTISPQHQTLRPAATKMSSWTSALSRRWNAPPRCEVIVRFRL